MVQHIIRSVSVVLVAVALVVGAALVTSFTGCAHYPVVKDMDTGAPASCLDYQRCLYYAATSKQSPASCEKMADRCGKDRVFTDYVKYQKIGLPVVYDRNGEKPMNFQEYWDKVR